MNKLLEEYNKLCHERGAIAIEAPFILFLIFVLIYFTVDLGTLLLNKGKVERVSHSLAAIIRERTALYNGSKTISSREVDDLVIIGERMLRESFPVTNFAVKVNATNFIYDEHHNIIIDDRVGYIPTSEKNGLLTEITPQSFSYSSNGRCEEKTPLSKEQLLNMTLESHRSDWQLVPVYQVTTCITRRDSNIFAAFMAKHIPAVNQIVVTNVVMPR